MIVDQNVHVLGGVMASDVNLTNRSGFRFQRLAGKRTKLFSLDFLEVVFVNPSL